MEANIKTKNVKFNLSVEEDKTIYDYFNEHKVNFSKIIKKLLLEYITNTKENTKIKETNEPVMELLEYHTQLLKEIIESGIKVKEDQKNTKENIEEKMVKKTDDDGGFNMDFLNQLG